MIKTTLRNFLKNFKYAFMTAGIVYFALIIGFFMLIQGIIFICGDNITLLFNDVVLLLSDYISAFNIDSIRIAPELLNNILESVKLHVSEFTGELTALAIGVLIIILILCAVSKAFAVSYINHETIKGNGFVTILSVIFRSVISILFAVLIILVAAVWKYSAIIFIILYVLLSGIMNMIMVKLSKGKSFPFKKLISLKNLIKLELCYLLAFITALIFTVIIAITLSLLVALLLFIPLVLYLFACTEATAYEYYRIDAT